MDIQVAEAGALVQARQVARRVASGLRRKLRRAVRAEGALASLAACPDQARQIDARESGRGGWEIERVALWQHPFRADAWARGVLEGFTRGASQGLLEETRVSQRDGQSRFRYLRAVRAERPCLACHGDGVSTQVAAALASRYPQDHPTGFAEGAVLGAYLLSRPLGPDDLPAR